MIPTQNIGRGFSDKVLSAQGAFRSLLDAMARPGLAPEIKVDCEAPAGLGPATAALALTLFDHDTPVWRDEALNGEAVARWLRFHTAAPLTGDPAQAAFALIGDPARLADFSRFAVGTSDYPDRSTTLILQVASLTSGAPLLLRGPGIEGEAKLAPGPLPPGFVAMCEANRALFPRGVDLVFCAGDSIAALPRTTRVSQQES
jgi:alpha-D-ribose 1-methylphosphonate 5-triphosphate synthase subunit PhnH